MIVDYAWSKPGGAALVAAGVTGVMRYLSHDSSKTLQRSEADDLASHGIAMGVVFEDMANRAGDGYQAGMNDAVVAGYMLTGQRSGYTDLAMPAGRPIYFACDYDANWVEVAPYFAGAAHQIGQDRVGIYAGLKIIEAAANAGYKWLWQTGAWSGGQWSPKAVLRQEIQSRTIGGVDCDVNDHQAEDWGQWTPGGEIVTPQDKQDIAKLVLDGIPAVMEGVQVRDALANANLWWLDHALGGTTTPSMSDAQKALITDIHNLITQLNATPKP